MKVTVESFRSHIKQSFIYCILPEPYFESESFVNIQITEEYFCFSWCVLASFREKHITDNMYHSWKIFWRVSYESRAISIKKKEVPKLKKLNNLSNNVVELQSFNYFSTLYFNKNRYGEQFDVLFTKLIYIFFVGETNCLKFFVEDV